jgi:hypothetical protein
MGSNESGGEDRTPSTGAVELEGLAEIPYWPRAIWEPFHLSEARFRIVVAHRRAGKTVAFINEAIRRALECEKRNPRFGYVAPFLSQAKSIAWDYVRQYCRDGASFHETELRADLINGGRVRLFGVDNPDALRGLYFDGVILDEFGDMDPRVWTEVIRPTLSDREGWACAPRRSPLGALGAQGERDEDPFGRRARRCARQHGYGGLRPRIRMQLRCDG